MTELSQETTLGERSKTAFEFAQETTKQLLTLSTAVVTISLTLAQATLQEGEPLHWLLQFSWYLFLFSIGFGWWSLASLTGSLGKLDEIGRPSIYDRSIALPSKLQALSFLAGLLVTILFVVYSR